MKRLLLAVMLLAVAPFAFAQVTHKGTGVVKSVDAKKGTVMLAHGPIQSLNWPAMTMRFRAKDKQLVEAVKPGQKVEFDFVQEGRDYVITGLK